MAAVHKSIADVEINMVRTVPSWSTPPILAEIVRPPGLPCGPRASGLGGGVGLSVEFVFNSWCARLMPARVIASHRPEPGRASAAAADRRTFKLAVRAKGTRVL